MSVLFARRWWWEYTLLGNICDKILNQKQCYEDKTHCKDTKLHEVRSKPLNFPLYACLSDRHCTRALQKHRRPIMLDDPSYLTNERRSPDSMHILPPPLSHPFQLLPQRLPHSPLLRPSICHLLHPNPGYDRQRHCLQRRLLLLRT